MVNIWRRMQARWSRVFAQKDPHPWEKRDAAVMLRKLSADAWACKLLADKLDLDIDPGESAADYISQMAMEVHRDVQIAIKERDIAKLRAGLAP